MNCISFHFENLYSCRVNREICAEHFGKKIPPFGAKPKLTIKQTIYVFLFATKIKKTKKNNNKKCVIVPTLVQ